MPTYTTKTTPSARGPGGTLSASCFAVHNAQNWALASAQITTYLQAPNAPCSHPHNPFYSLRMELYHKSALEEAWKSQEGGRLDLEDAKCTVSSVSRDSSLPRYASVSSSQTCFLQSFHLFSVVFFRACLEGLSFKLVGVSRLARALLLSPKVLTKELRRTTQF